MTPIADLPDRVVLALLVWGEARGESLAGQVAVACVVRNRLKQAVNTAPRWRDVCLAPAQFSCFNPGSPEEAAMGEAAKIAMTSTRTPALSQALWIADGVMSGAALDLVHGADHYLTTSLLQSAPPSWAKDQPVLAVYGAHSFLKVA